MAHVKSEKSNYKIPEILAPAGNRASFLAALSAGADAVYCGLKAFSARMASENFELEELSRLTRLAHEKGSKVYIAFNSMLKTSELPSAGEIIYRLEKQVKPDGLIIQDPAMFSLIKQANFSKEVHLSTLSNMTLPSALDMIHKTLNVKRVVLPRELNIDEIKSMAAACPPGIGLEVFVHGALCYGVSGRCYWSSYLGGKSGLRGRCVQPCRRQYNLGKKSERFFSCQDLSLDVLVKVLATVPEIKAWKIEGRKKGPHYVYYTTTAYRLMRDEGSDPQCKKKVIELLGYALGRPVTHYYFLPQRPQNPIKLEGHTGSGLLIGKIKGEKNQPYLIPREMLYAGDLLRIGYEDEKWHTLIRVNKWVPKNGKLVIKRQADHKMMRGASVFLIDRREPELEKQISKLQNELDQIRLKKGNIGNYKFVIQKPGIIKGRYKEMNVFRYMPKTAFSGRVGFWLDANIVKQVSPKILARSWWWLPPVIWPEEENQFKSLLETILQQEGKYFVLNAPWQVSFFPSAKKLNLWAGPFCNITNPCALIILKKIGFKGAVVSPELGANDFLQLASTSPIQLGIVCFGNWPICISRTLSDDIAVGNVFSSPKNEDAWVQKYGQNFWLYPNWRLDIRNRKKELVNAGYTLFVNISEPVPMGVHLKKRPGQWNWEMGLL